MPANNEAPDHYSNNYTPYSEKTLPVPNTRYYIKPCR